MIVNFIDFNRESNHGTWRLLYFSFLSFKNIDIVCRIRNEFESIGQNPKVFHLRCLDGNYKGRDEEFWSLIYREIEC